MMLDAKRTFDELSSSTRPTSTPATRCSSNRIYQELSNAVAGSQEYMAMEKLYELHQEGRYDLLVLDTPPTRNALDFLDAPRAAVALHRLALAPVLHRARGARAEGARPRHAAALLGAEARHRHRPARGPVATSSGASATWPRASASAPTAVNALLADSRTRLPAGHLAARATPSTRRSSSTDRLREAGLPFARRGREPRAHAVPAHGARRGRRARGAARRRARPQGGRATSTTTARWPSATAQNLDGAAQRGSAARR